MNAPSEPRGEAHLPAAAEQRTQSLAAPPAIPQNTVNRDLSRIDQIEREPDSCMHFAIHARYPLYTSQRRNLTREDRLLQATAIKVNTRLADRLPPLLLLLVSRRRVYDAAVGGGALGGSVAFSCGGTVFSVVSGGHVCRGHAVLTMSEREVQVQAPGQTLLGVCAGHVLACGRWAMRSCVPIRPLR